MSAAERTDPLALPPLADLVSLAGRVAVVTGGGNGVGAAICQRLHEAGAIVVVADVDSSAATSVASTLTDRTAALVVDVRSEESVRSMAAEVVDRFGRIDIWVNNVGIYPRAPFLEMTVEQWTDVLDTNLRGTYLGCQAAARAMTAAGTGGTIVNLASASAFRSSAGSLAHYSTSKAGVVGLTRSLAVELGPSGVRVLAVAPILVPTATALGLLDELGHNDAVAEVAARVPLRSVPGPDDVARVVLFAASDLSAMMTGSTLLVDAGQLVA